MMTSAAFSPIMKIALAMNSPGILGNTEASTTRRPSVPCTLKSLDKTPPRSLRADRAGARGVMAPRAVAHELLEIVLALDLLAG